MANQEIVYRISADNKQAVEAFSQLARVQGITEQATKKLHGSTQGSNMMLLSTSRIVQDLPFGLMGVGNNITFLAEQMAQAKSQGVGFKDMLIGMGKSLAGPGGIIFLISTATSVLTIFAMRSGSAKTEAESLTESLKKMWGETYRLNVEWSKFGDDLKKFSTADLIESLNALETKMKEVKITFLEATLARMGFTGGVIGKYEEAVKLIKEYNMVSAQLRQPKILGWDDVPKNMQDKWKQSFNERKKDIKEVNDLLQEMYDIILKTSFGVGSLKAPDPMKQFREFWVGGQKEGVKPTLGFSDAEIKRDFLKENQLLLDTIVTSADVLRSEFSSAWEDIFGEANSLFEKLMMNIVESMASSALTNLAGGLLNWLVPGLGTVSGLATGSQKNPSIINLQVDNRTLASFYVGGKNEATRLRMN